MEEQRSLPSGVAPGVAAAGESGQAVVEFALCLPLLLLIVTGLLAFGVTMNNYLLLTDATNVAGRQLAVMRGQTTDPCAAVSSAVSSAAPLLQSSRYTFTTVLNGTTYSGTSCSSGSTTTGAAGNLVQGGSARITVSYPCTLGVYGMSFPSCMLQAQTAELVQ